MENVRYTIDEEKTQKEIKKLFKRERRRRRLKETGRWIGENKEMLLVLGPAVIGLAVTVIKTGTTVVKAGARRINISAEKKVKDHYCYDRSLGHYWKLRRELSNKEWTEIDKRKKNGERLSDILNDLRVLK